MEYIRNMRGFLTNARGYGNDGFELVVTVSFDAKQFNAVKKRGKESPLAIAMPQIKNVVFDATGIRGIPSYSRPSMHQEFPRASKGIITLTVYFDVSLYTVRALVSQDVQEYSRVNKSIDLQSTLDATRGDGHLFAKTAIASHFGN